MVNTSAWRGYSFDPARLDVLHAVLAAYLGHFRLASHHRLVQSLWRDFSWLGEYLRVEADGRTLSCRVRVTAQVAYVRDPYRGFQRAFAGDAQFMQVGRYIKYYQPDERALAASLSFNPLQPNRHGASWGFPLRQFIGHLMRLLRQGRSVTWVGETGQRLACIETRQAQWRFVPAAMAGLGLTKMRRKYV